MLRRFVFGILVCFIASHEARAQYFDHMDIGASVGVTGLGLDVAMPVGKAVRVRAGFTYMPKFEMKTDFPIETGDGNRLSASELNSMTQMLANLTNMKVDDQVTMNMTPTFNQFKFLVDIMPFKHNRHWSLTLGFYAGPARIGRAYNVTEDAPTLLGVTMYNYFYVNSCKQESMFGDVTLGGTSLPHVELSAATLKKGMMGMPLGTFKDGDKAMLVPDDNGMVKAEMQVNKFRPYVGLGYNTSLSKDHRWNMSVDAGVLFWGGSPRVYVDNVYKIDTKSIDVDNFNYDIVHPNADYSDFVVDEPLDHVDMIDDLKGIHGKVGDFVKAFRGLKVMPNVGVTFSYRVF